MAVEQSPHEATHESRGLLHSLTAFAVTLLAIVHTRLALVSIDLEEAKSQLLTLFAMVLIAVFCLVAGLILATILLVITFWDTHRLLALAVMAGFFLACSVTIFIIATHKARTSPKLFATSLGELYKDQQQLKPRP
jgi:uncharacterized membrane protein YqjE